MYNTLTIFDHFPHGLSRFFVLYKKITKKLQKNYKVWKPMSQISCTAKFRFRKWNPLNTVYPRKNVGNADELRENSTRLQMRPNLIAQNLTILEIGKSRPDMSIFCKFRLYFFVQCSKSISFQRFCGSTLYLEDPISEARIRVS